MVLRVPYLVDDDDEVYVQSHKSREFRFLDLTWLDSILSKMEI